MVELLTYQEIHDLECARSATILGGLGGAEEKQLLRIDSILTKLEATSQTPPKSILDLLASLAETSIEYVGEDFHIGNVDRGTRALSLLEKWGCDNELVDVASGFYAGGRTFAISSTFEDVVNRLMKVAKDDRTIGFLAGMKQDIESDSGCFAEIGYRLFECNPDLESFNKAERKWNDRRKTNNIYVDVSQEHFDELAEKGGILIEQFWFSVKNKKLRVYEKSGQEIRENLAKLFESMPNTIKEKIAVFGIENKNVTIRHGNQQAVVPKKPVAGTI